MKRPEQTARQMPTTLYIGGRPFVVLEEESLEVPLFEELVDSARVVRRREVWRMEWAAESIGMEDREVGVIAACRGAACVIGLFPGAWSAVQGRDCRPI